jgi:hypothetical protein
LKWSPGTGGSHTAIGTFARAKSRYDTGVESPHALHSTTTVPGARMFSSGGLRDGTTRLHRNGTEVRHFSGVSCFAEYAVVPEEALIKIDDQFMLKRNYAKTLVGLSVRILSKIAAVTFLQFINFNNQKPINHLKYALCTFN